VLFRDADEGFVVSPLVSNEGAIGFDNDAVLLAVFDTFALLAPGVELQAQRSVEVVRSQAQCETYLNLVHSRHLAAERLDLFHVLNAIVADANVSHHAVLLCHLEGLPHQLPGLFSSIRGMNEEKVYITALPDKLLDTLANLVVCRSNVLLRAKDLRRDVDLLASQSALSQGLPDFSLVLVVLSGIDVAVADFKCLLARRDAYVRGRLVYTEADLRNRVLRVLQGEGRLYDELACRHLG
jgi:hypothetical protein